LIFSIIFWFSVGFNITFFALAWIVWLTIWIWIWIIQILRRYNHLLKLQRDKIDKNLVYNQFKYAFWVFLTVNIWTLLWNIDQQLVVNKLGAESSWYFTNMISLLNIFIMVISPLVWLIFPIATELSTRKEKEKFVLLESTMYTYFAFLALVIWWLFFVIWQEISVLLYWEKFRFSWELLQILWPCLIFQCLSWLNFNLLAWLGKIKQRFVILLISLIVNVTCNILALFVFNLGLHAVISVLALSRVIQFALWLIYIRKEYPFNFDWKFFIKNVLIVCILCLLLRCIKNISTLFYSNQNRWQLLFILIGICMIYVWIIAGFNRWKIKFLRNEVKKVRKSDL
jgi:O-antigen/teichoic acid export membrane protein